MTARPDWRDMTRADFDAGADLGGLFELAPGHVAADDRHGTADLLALLDGRADA